MRYTEVIEQCCDVIRTRIGNRTTPKRRVKRVIKEECKRFGVSQDKIKLIMNL